MYSQASLIGLPRSIGNIINFVNDNLLRVDQRVRQFQIGVGLASVVWTVNGNRSNTTIDGIDMGTSILRDMWQELLEEQIEIRLRKGIETLVETQYVFG